VTFCTLSGLKVDCIAAQLASSDGDLHYWQVEITAECLVDSLVQIEVCRCTCLV